MSTIVIDERERERRFTNEINKSVRNCRIGRVRLKMKMPLGFTLVDAWTKKKFPSFSGGYVPAVSSGDVVINPVHGVMM